MSLPPTPPNPLSQDAAPSLSRSGATAHTLLEFGENSTSHSADTPPRSGDRAQRGPSPSPRSGDRAERGHQEHAGKRPAGLYEECSLTSSEEDEVLEVPDLAMFFADFPHIDFQTQIRICRAYASFLVAQLPKKPRKKRKNAE